MCPIQACLRNGCPMSDRQKPGQDMQPKARVNERQTTTEGRFSAL